MKRTIFAILLAMLIAVSLSGCTSSPAASPGVVSPSVTPQSSGLSVNLTDVPDYKIEITGGNVSPITVTYADLKTMDMVEMKGVNQMAMNGKSIEHTSDYVGVPMMKILARAGIPDGDVTITMTASDNYTMDYTRAELENAPLGLECNGTILTTDVEGDAIVLVEPDQGGPMWTRVPVKIQIHKVI